MSSQIYLLDADVFIEARKSYYPFDVFPSFWEWLKQQAIGGNVRTIRPVYDDICKGNDGLDKWIDVNCPQDFVMPIDKDPNLIDKYRALVKWAVSHPQFLQTAKNDFAEVSDAWLIAAAMASNNVVVTREVFDSNIKRRIKIPNACQAFGVNYKSSLEMMRDLKLKI